MAHYSYKEVTHRDDYLAAISLWQEQSGRESDEDPNYDGDCWLVTEFLLSQKDAENAALREALIGAQERGADLERALDHERTARLEAEELAERLQAGWDSNAQVGARALADIRSFQDAALGLVACATEAIRRADKAEERVAALEARGCSSEGHCPCCAEKLDRLRQERADALSVTSRDGLLSSEWVLRTGQAERRVAELEGLIAEHAATCDEACTGCGTTAMQRHREPCPWRDAYLSHHSRVTEPERLKAELRASVKAAERKRGGRR